MRRRITQQARGWACVCALLPALAAAQSPLPRANGVKVGDGRLHPSLELQTRVDSAAGFLNPHSVGQPPQLHPEFILHVRPGLTLDVPSETLALGLGGHLDLLWYTGLLTLGSQRFSRVQGQGSFDIAANPNGVVEVRLSDRLIRSDHAANPAVGVGVVSLYNQLELEVPIRPGGGALEITPGASYTFEFFSPISVGIIPGCPTTDPLCSTSQVSALNYGNLALQLQGSYRFLPKTAVVVDAEYNFRDYFNAGSRSSRLLVLTGGLSGLLSPKVSLLAKAGWANDYRAEFVRSIVGTLELTWLVSQTANIKVGYLRRLEPIALFGSYVDDRGYLEGRALVGGRLTLRGYASFDLLTFWETSRTDSQVRLDLGPEYAVTRWLTVGGGYLLTTRASSQSAAQTFNYARHEGYLRVVLSY